MEQFVTDCPQEWINRSKARCDGFVAGIGTGKSVARRQRCSYELGLQAHGFKPRVGEILATMRKPEQNHSQRKGSSDGDRRTNTTIRFEWIDDIS